jgi:hypothetical protein
VTDRHLVAYLLIAVMVAGLAAIVWWNRYHSYAQTYTRQQERRRKQSDARAMAHLAAADEEERP